MVDGPAGTRIMLIKQGDYDPSKVSVNDVMKISYMVNDVLLWEDDHTAVAGQTIVVDLKGLSFGHIAQFSPSLIK